MPVDFKIRDFFYPVSILKMHRFLGRSQWYPEEKLTAYQLKQLQIILTHAYEHVPYYHDVLCTLKLAPADFTTLEDLQKIPVLAKNILRKNFSRLIASNARKFHPKLNRTSGSSAEPIEFYLDKPANVLEFCYYWRHWSWAGYRLGARFAELTSHYFLNHPETQAALCHFNRFTGRIQLNSLLLSQENIKKYAEIIRTYNPQFLNGLASSLYFFALLCKNEGITDLCFKGVFSQGEMLIPQYRNLIEHTFHCKVLDSYGHMERTAAISQCPDGGYHVNSEYGILELIPQSTDLSGKRIIGKVIGTSLHNFSMPLIRYEVNDLVEISSDKPACPCGRGLPLITKIHGRQEDVIITPDDRIITDIFTVFDNAENIVLGQIVQESKKKLLIRVAKAPAYSPQSEKKLLTAITQYAGTEMTLSIEYTTVQQMREQYPGKFKAVVSQIRQSR